MLFPEHPKPVGRRRAVAELSVAYPVATTIAPGHVVTVAAGQSPALDLVARPPGVAVEPAIGVLPIDERNGGPP